jgi:ABC-2 type transport system permease protein
VRGALVIYRRELAALFLQPVAWVLLALALALNGWVFTYLLAATGDAREALEVALGSGTPYWLLALVLPPLVTMRMVSEEARSGMLELVLTAPVRDAALVVGKVLAATTFMAVLWAGALVYAAALAARGVAIDWGALAGAYLGAVAVALLFSSIGILASAISGTPLVAAFLAATLCALLLVVPLLLGSARWLGRDLAEAIVRRASILARLSNSFLRGVLDTGDLVFFAAAAALAMFLATRAIESRRWRA